MTTKTKLCFFVAVLCTAQFISCKKDNSNLVTSANAESTDDAAANSAANFSLTDGLVAWYTFNGDVLDHSGHNNNVIFNSAKTAKGKSGVAKTAYMFDGVSSYMQVADSKSFNALKISLYALVKPQGFYQGKCHGNRILSKGYNDYANGRIDLGFDDQAYYNYAGCDEPVTKFQNFYGSYGDGSNATGANDLTNYVKKNEWYSVVYTYDGINSKLYVNGVLVNRVTQSTTFNENTDPLYIGRNEDPGYPYYFNGVIDEIRIYKRVLHSSEILALSNNN